MEMRRLGSLEVSLVGLGCSNFGRRCGETQAKSVVHAALDAGINFFDTSDSYGETRSEEFLGRILVARRDEVVIATKFGSRVDDHPTHAGAGARWICQAVEGSLRRLGTDRIDLYQQHWPDPEVPQEETLEALDRLVRAGKVLEIGNSNFSADQIDTAAAISQEAGIASFVSAQNHFNLIYRRALQDIIPACRRHVLGLLPYRPLAHGLLTGKYRGGRPSPGSRLAQFPEERLGRVLSQRNVKLVERLSAWAESRGHCVLELAVAWLAAQPAIASIIVGAMDPEQVAANAAAAGWHLTTEDLSAIDRLLMPSRSIQQRARARIARLLRTRR